MGLFLRKKRLVRREMLRVVLIHGVVLFSRKHQCVQIMKAL